MGVLVNGVWKDGKSANDRDDTPLNSWITSDGAAGPTGQAGIAAESGRYHLYVSWACPFAHRALLARTVMGLEDQISVTYMSDIKPNNGWEMPSGADSIFDKTRLYQVIAQVDPQYTGRASVPVLYDKTSKQIVSNSSADISAMLLEAFSNKTQPEYRPVAILDEIEKLNQWIHNKINLGVYRVGFSLSQNEYEEAVISLFDALDVFEQRLESQAFLHGDTVTESDFWLFATLIRFDSVYVSLFKCSLRRIADYTVLSEYLQRLWHTPGVAATVDMERIKAHYFQSLMHSKDGPLNLNPSGLIPIGPNLNL